MRMTLRALAALLGYPSEELHANAGEVRAAIRDEVALPRVEMERLELLLRGFETEDLLDLQSAYSELFDRSRSLSLHLFEHVHGDSRERGQAMIDLGQQYMEHGFFLEASELPDFVPVFLEFASCLPPAEAREMLGQPAHVFAALAERLDKRQSPYAAIFHALVSLAGVRPAAEAVAQVEENTPAVDPPTIDEEWEEAPVSFNLAGAHEMGGPTGVVAKIRASNRAVNREAGQ
ncbi:nitrate reductase molybdenum cofactor assembly chaperone [Sphingosinicella rhizophila]|uniref:Nitrate reductase molybdenum cofactor assembly chaperone n=1 Tax=Sphingosinicella rhizophila TaxID=3050082 RepID=A0ABU3Q916_9SPHN|nr:nitrate reductase molybdenum cofactor assembly chaperone [Sphingosinicella sp. GR2756]MDT9599898.1 nitrate reductase molybdenum cofactor assembly chaperone [Sphingosinicella sp. GR2756]